MIKNMDCFLYVVLIFIALVLFKNNKLGQPAEVDGYYAKMVCDDLWDNYKKINIDCTKLSKQTI